jgi:hypothetical protein
MVAQVRRSPDATRGGGPGGWEQDEVDREVTGDAGLLDDADLRKWL